MPEVPHRPIRYPSQEAFAKDMVTNLVDLGLGLPAAQVLTAHMALSTGWGLRGGADNYRLAGIKATSEAQEYTVNRTRELDKNGREYIVPRAKFRSYRTLKDGLRAILRLLSVKRYRASKAYLMAGDVRYFRQLGADGWYTAKPDLVHVGCMARLKKIQKWTTHDGAALLVVLVSIIAGGLS